MSANLRHRLRELLAGDEPIVAPGIYDCISARLVERAGFRAAVITGAGLAASVLGVPDLGLITMSEVLAQTRNMVRSVGIPIVADCDTGYGNQLNVMRTVQEFEQAGVAALFIEDQVTPKRCGHFDGKEVVSQLEMVRKIEAAVAARTDPEMCFIVRTDALAVEGMDSALVRAEAYAKAGADMIYVEAPDTKEEMQRIANRLKPLGLPLYINTVEGGHGPLVSVQDMAAMGYKLIVFSGSMQKTSIKAMDGFLESLRRTGSVEEFFPSKMVSLSERSDLLGMAEYTRMSERFAAS